MKRARDRMSSKGKEQTDIRNRKPQERTRRKKADMFILEWVVWQASRHIQIEGLMTLLQMITCVDSYTACRSNTRVDSIMIA